ncbi:MAG: hypothetical protein OQK51_12785 [Kangiellaceae bacterium]|nr:hypothetical protein [Kangiellaceae bacterium]
MDSNISIELISWAMDRALASHSVSRMNAANASVKNFAPIKISFENQLSALESAKTVDDINATLHSIKQTVDQMMEQNTVRMNGETVQIDQEVREMVKHSGYYKSLADVMSRKMGLMKIAISGRG